MLKDFDRLFQNKNKVDFTRKKKSSDFSHASKSLQEWMQAQLQHASIHECLLMNNMASKKIKKIKFTLTICHFFSNLHHEWNHTFEFVLQTFRFFCGPNTNQGN